MYPRTRLALPRPPQYIALITSKNSEALHDFQETYRRENGRAYIQIMDSPIQTEDAPLRISERIYEANSLAKTDVIVLVRGGGRNQDFQVFNNLQIAEAICKSRIPVVTGIGHQQDETIADRVADELTITPTDAAFRLAKLEPQIEGTANTVVASTSQFSQDAKIVAEHQLPYSQHGAIQTNPQIINSNEVVGRSLAGDEKESQLRVCQEFCVNDFVP